MTDVERDETVGITLNGAPVDARPGELVIEAAERAGVFIPRFCYHPRMDPVGMCRMCLVEISGPRGFTLQPACYVHVAEGQEIVSDSEKARKAQEGVLELLLTNHPLDCPVCDKGGECPLQDQSMAHGPGESRFIEPKRHWPKPIPLGPLVALDRERCIQCARCTRFADEIAGEALIDFAHRGSEIEVAAFPLAPFSSHFSGNTVQICPVGALTATPYRFKSRPWDLEQVETTCEVCAVGCRTVLQSSAGEPVRALGVDVDEVNHSWLCDRGRFAYESTQAAARLRTPLVIESGEQREASWHEALGRAAEAIRSALAAHGPSSVAFIGGARLTNEEAYAFAKLAKSVVGTDSVDAQLGDGLPAELVLGLPRATIDAAAAARAVVVLDDDVREELPVLFLRLRAAATSGTSVIEITSTPTALGAVGVSVPIVPGDLARAAALVAGDTSIDAGGIDANAVRSARARLEAAGVGDDGDGVVVVVGRGDLAVSAGVATSAAATLHRMWPKATFLTALRRGNVQGALDMGLAPGLLPGRLSLDAGRAAFAEAWGEVAAHRGTDAIGTLEDAADGRLDVLVTLGADVRADVPDRGLVQRALAKVPTVIAIATHEDATTAAAEVVLPVAAESERYGTVTNLEGRVAPTAQKIVPPGVAWPAWVVASELARRLGGDLGFEDVASIAAEAYALAPAYHGVGPALADPLARRAGVVVPLSSSRVSISVRPLDPIATPGIASVEEQGAPIRVGRTVTPRSVDAIAISSDVATLAEGLASAPIVAVPPPAPGTFRLGARRSLYDQGTLVQAAAALAPLAVPFALRLHPDALASLGAVAGDAVRVRVRDTEFEVPAASDAGIDPRVAVLGARNEPGSVGAFDLLDAADLAVDVDVRRA